MVCADIRRHNPLVNGEEEEEGEDDESEERALSTHELIEEHDGSAIFVRTDVGNSQDIQRLIQTAVNQFGRLDMYVRKD